MRPNLSPLFAVLCCWPAGLAAQETPIPEPAAEAEPPTVESAEASLEALESSDADDLTKTTLGDRYREAVETLKQAEKFRTLEEEYRQALKTGTDETQKFRDELATLENTTVELPASLNEDASAEEVEDALSRELGELSLLQGKLEELEDELLTIRNRPVEMRERLIAADGDLKTATAAVEAVRREITGEPSPSQKAELTRLQAMQEMLEAEVAMIGQEDASDEIRLVLKELDRDLTVAGIAAAEKRVTAIRALASKLLSRQAREAEALVKRIQSEVPNAPPTLETLQKDLIAVIAEVRAVAGNVRSVERQQQARDAERKRIEETFTGVKRQVSIGGLEGSLAQLLLERVRDLPSKQESRERIGTIKASLAEARRGFYEMDRDALEKERAAAGSGIESSLPPDRTEFQDEIDALEAAHDVLTADLEGSYRRWIGELGTLELTERQIIEASQEFREYVTEKLFWVRSSRPLALRHLADLSSGLAYCFGWERAGEISGRIGTLPLWFFLGVGSVFVMLIGFRRRFRQWLRASGLRTRRIPTDRYIHTLVAFLMTILLALPAPWILAAFGWALLRQGDASEWSLGFGKALLEAAWFLVQVGFLITLCRKDGLGVVHFRWNEKALARLRRLSFWLISIHLPLTLILVLVLTESNFSYLSGLGRLATMAMVIGVGAVIAAMLHPEKGIAASVHEHTPRSLFGRLRHVWYYLVLTVIAILVVLLLAGFVFTGVLLSAQIELSASAILTSFVVYGMVVRWIVIRERKLALNEVLAARKAQREAAREAVAAKEAGDAGSEDARIPEIQLEDDRDLSESGIQTRNLISFLVGVGLATALWFIWTKFAPILDMLDRLKAFGTFSVGDLALTVLVVMVIVETTRNLPGLLEILVLRRLDIDAGTRNAITTLAKYFVISIGAIFLFNRIGVDWSQFGWIAAALGVGIGFGLQEVVANFISGIILLFERPIRVGDIVTVDGVDGIVSRIQIRATTVTNWDRKELIIPNKNFITGTVLNWTLSNALNRIVIVVGAAYGSDTEKARQILIDVANDHPRICEDPPPLATFEAFDASSLRLLLRCYVPDMDGRIVTITELHTEIDKRFREAGIEIAFPQQDLHLRSVDPGVSLGESSRE